MKWQQIRIVDVRRSLVRLPALQEVKKARPTSVLLQMFADAKLDEIIAIYSKATTQERQEGYKMLFEIYPAQSTRLEELQKPVR